MKIIVDCLGGDNTPLAAVEGAVRVLNEYKDAEIIFVGPEEEIKKILGSLNYNMERVSIVNSTEEIKNDEHPVEAIRAKKNSSMVMALDLLKAQGDIVGLVSAGSTGALLAGGMLKIGRIKGVTRPCISPAFITSNGGWVTVADGGANMDATVANILHFALMGNEYAKCAFKTESPRCALLNVGTEDGKGNELCKAAFKELKKLPINFEGNMEARDFLSGKYDVVISDGFWGNVLIKSTEGALKAGLKIIKGEIMSTGLGKMGGLLLKPTFKKIMHKLDYTNYSGSPILGINKLVIKTHGSSVASTFYASLVHIIDMHKGDLVGHIKKAIEGADIKE